MWSVINRTPFTTAGYFARDRHGVEHWCLVLRGRFAVRPGGLTSLVGQEPPRLAPTYRDPEARELAAEADLAPFRPYADVLINGAAVAEEGALIERLPIRIKVGSLEKRAIALAPRRMIKRGGRWKLLHQAPVEAIALSWTNAVGGRDPFAPEETAESESNPIGRAWSTRLAAVPDGAELDLPLLENPAELYHADRPMPAPIGFGPLQPAWRPRRDHAGTYDAAWRESRAPLLPEDFSEAFHQAAPADQIYPEELRGGEVVEIEGLHSEGPYAFRLPQVIAEARTWIGPAATTHRFRLIAVEIDATSGALDMIWNASLVCGGRDFDVDRSLVTLRQMAGVA